MCLGSVVAVGHLHCCVPCCRLIELCEARLVSELLALAPAAAAAEAPHLLCLADELGLVQLRRAAVTFICQHYKEVQVSIAGDQPLGGPGGAGPLAAGLSAPLTTCTQLVQNAPLLCVVVEREGAAALPGIEPRRVDPVPPPSHMEPCSHLARVFVCLQASEAWHSLDRSQVELVASQLAAEMASLRRLLGEMEPPSGMGAPPKRRGWW